MNKRKLSAKRTGTSSVKQYVNAVNGQHVTPDGGGDWQVKRSGSKRASKVFSKQQDAIKYAREVAMNQQTELFVHGRNGQIRERNTYRGDPFPPRG